MLVSIIIPAYNVEQYITTTIKSLILQDETNFEIIVINDGSKDNTLGTVRKLLDESEHKQYKIINKENDGVSSARNRGISEASGEYILFLDGDDYVSSDFIHTLYKNIDGQTDILFWKYSQVDENNIVVKKYHDNYSRQFDEMTGEEALYNIIVRKSMWIWTGSAVYRTELIRDNNIQYEVGCVNGEDQEFTFKTLMKAKKVRFLNKVLSFYVQRNNSISNSYNINRFQAINAMKRVYDCIESTNFKLGEVKERIKYDIIVETFFYNYNSCINVLKSGGYNAKKTAQKINRDLELAYPGLDKNISKNIRKYNGDSWFHKYLYKMYLISPSLYVLIIHFKNYVTSRSTI